MGEVGVDIMGCGQNKVLFRGLSEIYLSCYNLVLQINNLEAAVSMLSCGALERNNNPYIESIVEPCVSKNQK